MRFKVGDKVRVREDLEAGINYGKEVFIKGMNSMCGKEVTIEWIITGLYILKEYGYRWSEEMLEPLEKENEEMRKEFTLDDLKTGMVVEQRYGERFVVTKGDLETEVYGKKNIIGINAESFMLLNDLNKNLKSKERKEYDIVKVYKPYVRGLKYMLNDCNKSNLIWEEEPKTDWSKVTENSLIELEISNNKKSKLYFHKYLDGVVYYFIDGRTSKTEIGIDCIDKKCCRLLEMNKDTE